MNKITRNILITLVIIGYAISILLLFQPVYAYLSSSYRRIADMMNANKVVEVQTNGATDSTSLKVSDISHMRLKIPAIGVDAPVELEKINSQNTLTAPKRMDTVGLFKISPSTLPKGEQSIVVIDGHRGWVHGPSVFDNLYKLKAGDTVYIEDKEKNVLRTFEVIKSHSYNATDNPVGIFTQNEDQTNSSGSSQIANPNLLNIITCDGDWDPIQKTYDKRLVVFTKEVY